MATRQRRTEVRQLGQREAHAIALRLGAQVRDARRRRRLTQAQLGARVGLDQTRISQLEGGRGARAPLEVWVALGLAIGRPLAIDFSRDIESLPTDAGHLRPQELVLRLARTHGRPRTFELPTRPASPARSIDVGLRDDADRALAVVEISNRRDDLGQFVRDLRRKLAEAEALAIAIGGDAPYRVAACWVLVDTAANRRLIATYPEVIANAFPGPSRAWVRALADGDSFPTEPGLVWVDQGGTRLHEHRRAATATSGASPPGRARAGSARSR